MINFNKNHQGFSLIELLVAVTISSLLLVGAVTLLINNKRVFKNQNEMGRVQENTRYAIERLFDDIRLSAYIGCSDDASLVTNNVTGVATGALLDMSNAIEGSENAANWSPSGTAFQVANMIANTDAITIRSLSGTGATIKTPYMTDEDDTMFIDIAGGFIVGDVIAISDCSGTDIFKVSAITDTDVDPADGDNDTRELAHASAGGNASNNLNKIYNTNNARVNRFRTRRYYIGTGSKGNSLFMSNSDTTAGVELVEGVDDMQIMYGVDTSNNGIPNNYFVAGDASLNSTSEWDSVVSVRITLTFRVIDRDFSDSTIPTRSVTTTVQIRNRT